MSARRLVTSGSSGGFSIRYAVHSDDATDFQEYTGEAFVHIVKVAIP